MKNPIEEARRYVANAKDVIKNANYERKFKMYMDGKYVKMAGDTLWKGCLIGPEPGCALLEHHDDQYELSVYCRPPFLLFFS